MFILFIILLILLIWFILLIVILFKPLSALFYKFSLVWNLQGFRTLSVCHQASTLSVLCCIDESWNQVGVKSLGEHEILQKEALLERYMQLSMWKVAHFFYWSQQISSNGLYQNCPLHSPLLWFVGGSCIKYPHRKLQHSFLNFSSSKYLGEIQT